MCKKKREENKQILVELGLKQVQQLHDTDNNNCVYFLKADKPSPAALACPSQDTLTVGKYTYTITAADKEKEQQAFQAGEGVNKNSNFIFIMHNTIVSIEERASARLRGLR